LHEPRQLKLERRSLHSNVMTAFAWIKAKLRSYQSKRVAGITVRYMFPAMLGTILLLSASSMSGVGQSYVYLTSNASTIAVGEIVSVVVGVSAHTPINAVDITLDFPADKVEVFSVDRGQSVLTIWTQEPVITNNSVKLTGGTFKRGFIGQHQIATVKFRTKATGQYSMTAEKITFVAGDGAGTPVIASKKPTNSVALFNFDETTSAEQIKIAIARGMTTDVNQDGQVTLQDISAFMGAWNNQSQVFDFNNDGKMTFKDFSILLADFFRQ